MNQFTVAVIRGAEEDADVLRPPSSALPSAHVLDYVSIIFTPS